MIFTIALKELKESVRDGRFQLLALTMLTLMVLAVFISRAHYLDVKAQHDMAKQNERNIWVSQDDKNPHSAAHYGTYAFKPKYPLSLLDHGVDKYSGVAIYLEAHHRNGEQYMAAQDQTGLGRFGELSPDFVLLYLFPLFIVLISFNAFSKEKESGTLRLLKSQGVPSLSMALGKWMGTFIVVLLMILPLMALAYILLENVKNFGELETGALLLLFLFYMIYYAVFINISLMVSALAKSSHLSFIILLAVWIVACLAIPKVSTNLARTMYPYPSQQEFMARIAADEKKGLNGHEPWSEEAKQLEKETLEKYGVDKVEDLPLNFDGILMQKSEEHTAEISFRHYELLRELYHKQASLYRTTAILSPYLPVRFLSMAFSRTDYDAHWEFSDAAERYRLKMMDALNMHYAENSKYGDWEYKADKSLWAKVPGFNYIPPSIGSVFSRNAGHFAALCGWLIVSFGLLFIGANRLSFN